MNNYGLKVSPSPPTCEDVEFIGSFHVRFRNGWIKIENEAKPVAANEELDDMYNYDSPLQTEKSNAIIEDFTLENFLIEIDDNDIQKHLFVEDMLQHFAAEALKKGATRTYNFKMTTYEQDVSGHLVTNYILTGDLAK